MATRTITCKRSSIAQPFVGESASFPMTSDTGAASGMSVIAAELHLSAVRSFSATQALQVRFGSTSSDMLAKTPTIPSSNAARELTLPLYSRQDALASHAADVIYLTVESSNANDQAATYFDAGCLLELTITYAGRCTAPENIGLSASESSAPVLMYWSAATGGTDNPLSHYEVARQESADGGMTWGGWETVGTTTTQHMMVDPPRATGNVYRYLVRAVGTAGGEVASYWVTCPTTLTKIEPRLIAYTDPVITAGVTAVKAVHITELQTNVNLVRAACNWTAYTFTPITAHYTSLGGWNAHITELRDAIDDVTIAHEAWLPLGDNCPRADVLEQLRRVVEAVAAS